MSFIFKNLDIEALFEKILNNEFFSKVFKFVKSNRILVKFASFCIVALFSIMVSIAAVGITIGFDVNYSGKVIATVSDSSVFDNAKDIAVKNVNSNKAEKAITKPKFVLTLTVTDKLTTPTKLADAIIENTNEILAASALVVNGETIVCADTKALSDIVEKRRTAFYVEGAENTASFVDTVEIIEGYYLKNDIKEISTVSDVVNNLAVKTVSTSVREDVIPFTVKKIKTKAYENGYKKVQKAGKNGLSRTTVVKYTVNGVKSEADGISSKIVTEPSEQVEFIGTAINKITANAHAEAVSKGFIRPLNSGTFKITSYYGDGRNHKGMDLAADKGTPIFTVANGTVTYAGYDSDFGYNVIVDHGNGIKTRYAHASALCVSKGEKVSQGDMIAAVGNTGYSLGNHLHFEVIVKGARVNPAPYIGY